MGSERLYVAMLIVFVASSLGRSQTRVKAPDTSEPYTMRVAVDEVDLTFHASDFEGRSIDDLTLADLRLLDNGKRPRRIVSFAAYRNEPVHAGILFDTSRSVLADLKRNQEIAKRYATRLMHQETDELFLIRVDSAIKLEQDWTNDAAIMTARLDTVAADHASRMGGTALFDGVYTACRDQWKKARDETTGNFLLIFSDGVDNASHARMEDVIDMCQQRRVSIYVFSNEGKSIFDDGQKVLKELTAKSGGRIFFDQMDAGILNDLRVMEADQRSQYRVVYKPARRKADGAFHRIQLTSPTRGGVIVTRSGYYAAR